MVPVANRFMHRLCDLAGLSESERAPTALCIRVHHLNTNLQAHGFVSVCITHKKTITDTNELQILQLQISEKVFQKRNHFVWMLS